MKKISFPSPRSALLTIAGLSIGVFASASNAQISVTVGSDDAVLCSQNAFDRSSDLDPCNSALRAGDLSRKDKAKTLINRGVIYNFRFEPQNAIADFDASLNLAPTIGESYANRGSSYFLLSNFDQALSDYKRALDLDSNMPWATWYNIGLVYQETKKTEKAKSAFKKSLSFKADFTPALEKLSQY